MKHGKVHAVLVAAGMLAASASCWAEQSRRPNVLMFAVDDMCDWIGPMGHEQAVTPNMDRLAAAGLTFQNAHTAGTFCAPSRSAIFTGRHATTTGCYTTQVYFHDHPGIRPLQAVLQDGGYATYGAGKLFHHPAGFVDLRGWNEFFVRDPAQKCRGWPLDSWTVDDPALPEPYPNSIFNRGRRPDNQFFLEWGRVLDGNEGKMADTIRTEWACRLLSRRHDRPVMVAVGLYAPHFPNYVPEKYFDLYDPERIVPPPYKADDLEDLPPAVRRAKEARSAHHRRLESLGAVGDAIHGYLASISYADAMLGRLLDAVESGPNADNTIVVFWSDHGYHHGEKFDWGKHTLWERTSNVPFIWAGPGIARGADVDATVSLIDMFPTLVELCGVGDGQPRDGVSLAPVLREPAAAVDRDVLLPGMRPGEYAVINRDRRYIRYADGGEELYDSRRDPNEWDNLAAKPGFEEVIEQLRQSAPPSFADPGPAADELRLEVDGATFRWRSKRAPVRVEPVPGAGVTMSPLGRSPEARTEAVTVGGRRAWKSAVRSGQATYIHFRLDDPSYRNGGRPAVQVAITYLDRGDNEVVVQYDSSDRTVNASHPKGAGVFKEAARFTTGDSGRWKTVVFNLEDAHFAGRCNDCDLRVVVPRAAVDPVVAEVLVKPIPPEVRGGTGPGRPPEGPSARGTDRDRAAAGGSGAAFRAVEAGEGEDLPDLANPAIKEASGLAQSRSGADLFWVNNDSGDSNRIFATNRSGADLGQLVITGARAVDYEDIATGPGPDGGRNYIYIADIGDNGRRRAEKTIYRVEEPDVSRRARPFDLRSEDAAVFRFTYAGGARMNAEALMIDPDSLDFYIVTKQRDSATLHRGSTRSPGVPQVLECLGELNPIAPGLLLPDGIVAGDISADGSEIIIRTHRMAFYWKRRPGESIADAMLRRPPAVFKGQWMEPAGECICIATDGSGYYTLGEEVAGYRAHLRHYPRTGPAAGRGAPAPQPAGAEVGDGPVRKQPGP